MRRTKVFSHAITTASLACLAAAPAVAQPPKPDAKGYEVEWVYRVRYGFIDEWWDLFRKYQIPVLDRAKELGYVVDYRIYHPQFHTDEAARWDYRIEITYSDAGAGAHEEEIAQTLFKDTATRKREENRRWELTVNHWDLPIYQVDTTKSR
jgi:opacity protein-like surface antigen